MSAILHDANHSSLPPELLALVVTTRDGDNEADYDMACALARETLEKITAGTPAAPPVSVRVVTVNAEIVADLLLDVRKDQRETKQLLERVIDILGERP